MENNTEETKWIIIFEREFEGRDFVFKNAIDKPTEEEAIEIIRLCGYEFNEGYDVIKEIYDINANRR